MVKIDYSEKAKEINDKIFGVERKNRADLSKSISEQVNENMRFSLGIALSEPWISLTQKTAFVEILKEQKDATNILFSKQGEKNKAVQILRPLFGAKGGKFLDSFQNHFDKLQKALVADLEKK